MTFPRGMLLIIIMNHFNYLFLSLINNILVPKSDIFMTCDISLGNTPIIYNVFCNNACYLNFAPSALKGYLFFYVDNWETENSDKIIYTNFVSSNCSLRLANLFSNPSLSVFAFIKLAI